MKISAKTIRNAAFAGVATVAFFSSPMALAQKFDSVTIASQPANGFSSFEQVYVAPVEVAVSSKPRSRIAINRGNEDRPVSEADQARKANDLQDDLERRLGNSFELVDSAGPGILTIETTITELQSSRPTIEDFSTQVGLSANSVYAGTASATFVISEDDKVLATISDQFYSTFNDGAPRVGIWSDVDRAFSRWARNINRFLTKN